jgi:hypothetical protein
LIEISVVFQRGIFSRDNFFVQLLHDFLDPVTAVIDLVPMLLVDGRVRNRMIPVNDVREIDRLTVEGW